MDSMEALDRLGWGEVFVPQWRERLQLSSPGVLLDRASHGTEGQGNELKIRDRVALPFLESPTAALSEASRHHSRSAMERRARRLVARAARHHARLVIDLGCGFGWHWIEAARQNPGIRFLLVDFSAENLRVCRILLPIGRYPNVLCLQANVLDLPVRAGVASLAWSVQVFQHLLASDRRVARSELRRTLAPGGAFNIAWVRCVPLVRLIYWVAVKPYHLKGHTPSGFYLERFNPGVVADLRDALPTGRPSYSESLFHPDLRLRPKGPIAGWLDILLSATPIAELLARQVEYEGAL